MIPMIPVIFSAEHKLHDPEIEFRGPGMYLRPYWESAARAESILTALKQGGYHSVYEPNDYGNEALTAVHDKSFLQFLENVWRQRREETGEAVDLVPDSFALRHLPRAPLSLTGQLGYYCLDAQTPILENTWSAVCQAAFSALTGAEGLIDGKQAVYVLCRPPGHHAGRDYYGGYCYLNNASLAAERLSREGRAAVLDLDYHHGNGTQDIFYSTDSVLVISLHADPNEAYPYFSGYPEESGQGAGQKFNMNYPLPPECGEDEYTTALTDALDLIHKVQAQSIVVSLGVDTFTGDPLCRMRLPVSAFSRIGGLIRQLHLPTLVVQEGGYEVGMMGRCVTSFLTGLEKGT